MTIEERIVQEGLAENLFAARHIAEGLHLAQLKTEEEMMERVKKYRWLRECKIKPKEAYRLAILGIDHSQPIV